MEVGWGKSLLDYYLPLPGNAFFVSPKQKNFRLLAFMYVVFGARGANRPHMCVWRLGPRGRVRGANRPHMCVCGSCVTGVWVRGQTAHTRVCVSVGFRRRMGVGKIQKLETSIKILKCVFPILFVSIFLLGVFNVSS